MNSGFQVPNFGSLTVELTWILAKRYSGIQIPEAVFRIQQAKSSRIPLHATVFQVTPNSNTATKEKSLKKCRVNPLQ